MGRDYLVMALGLAIVALLVMAIWAIPSRGRTEFRPDVADMLDAAPPIPDGTGPLRVVGNPAAATVTLNGQRTGAVADGGVLLVARGRYRIGLDLDGYVVAPAEVDLDRPDAEVTVSMTMMRVISGTTFRMGDGVDGPSMRRWVTVAPFAIDRFEVTRREFAQAAGNAQPPPGRERDLPMVFVTWAQAAAHCGRVGKRLPTSAEWELAARGTIAVAGAGLYVPDIESKPGLGGSAGPIAPRETQANKLDIHGMNSNVSEWVDAGSEAGVGPNESLARGAAFTTRDARLASPGFRGHVLLKSTRQPDIGLRCAATRTEP